MPHSLPNKSSYQCGDLDLPQLRSWTASMLCMWKAWKIDIGTARATLLKRPRTPPSTTPAVDYQSADSEHLMKRARPGVQPVDEVKTVNYARGPSHPQNNMSSDDLPKNVARSLNQGSFVMSMDFHPIQQSILLDPHGTIRFVLGCSSRVIPCRRPQLSHRNRHLVALESFELHIQREWEVEPAISTPHFHHASKLEVEGRAVEWSKLF